MRAFWIFVVATIAVLIALGYAGHLLGIQTQWLVIGLIVIGGISIASGAKLAKRPQQTNVNVDADGGEASGPSEGR